MSRINCPQCGTLDQVRSVPSIYESQTSTYAGTSTGYSSGVAYASGVGVIPSFGSSTVHTSGSSSSLLASHIAPPPPPRLAQPGGGCGLAVVLAFAAAWGVILLPYLFTSGDKDAGRNAAIMFTVLGGPFVFAAVMMLINRAKSRRQAREAFQSHSVVYPSFATAWSAAYLCLRCHVAYVPEGALATGASPAVPVHRFPDLVATTAARLRGEM
ncbi:hypothetical protein PUR71_09880 [Streptomyces sp. SP17BM10]|uniref:hypothetical protein n=1 Tax=Streptomyces sp. SP17BM10 TaxID=3002530 RepID=UPI002E7A49FD|nr:hypothetical protein [Streptomyces sp. SP17BM10]MEE1783222.1 hypothetical protein [Streptomyces sp. SP17BM10]